MRNGQPAGWPHHALLQLVTLHKKSQGCPACSHPRASPAFNKFKLSACAPPALALEVHPTKILPRHFLLTEIADGWIVLTMYASFIRNVCNLVCDIEWHTFSFAGFGTWQDCTLFRSCIQLEAGQRVWYKKGEMRIARAV